MNKHILNTKEMILLLIELNSPVTKEMAKIIASERTFSDSIFQTTSMKQSEREKEHGIHSYSHFVIAGETYRGGSALWITNSGNVLLVKYTEDRYRPSFEVYTESKNIAEMISEIQN